LSSFEVKDGPDKTVARIQTELKAIENGLAIGAWACVPTSRNLYAIVDRDLQERLSEHRWFAVISMENHAYPVADVNGKRVAMARLVLNFLHPQIPLQNLKQVSFLNKCSFDCRSSNLEHRVGRTAVMRNRRGKSGSSSQFKGVRKKVNLNKGSSFSASISDGSIRIGLGTYGDELEAARIYDAAAWLLFEGAAFMNVTSGMPALEHIEIASGRIRNRKTQLASKREP
jgi:hypothetical protein